MTEASITAYEFDYMLANSGAKVLNEAGDCCVYYASGSKVFVMQGPAKSHSLFAEATDLDRLNAHWMVFSGAAE